eukprot:INCI16100.1.p1 GENE.INCI16100.1~~INCI16100.1.p1  ORF type:complete len:1584 (+),score=395.51 INCI16100.1:138-4889(+)
MVASEKASAASSSSSSSKQPKPNSASKSPKQQQQSSGSSGKILSNPHAIYIAKQKAAKKLARKIEKRAAKRGGGSGAVGASRGRGRGRGGGGRGGGRGLERGGRRKTLRKDGRGIGGPCYAFQSGECTRGAECHFSHDGTNNPGKRPEAAKKKRRSSALRKSLQQEEDTAATGEAGEAASVSPDDDNLALASADAAAFSSSSSPKSRKRTKEEQWLAKQNKMRDGDWECSKCGGHNFASRNSCFKCAAKKTTRKASAAAPKSQEAAPKKKVAPKSQDRERATAVPAPVDKSSEMVSSKKKNATKGDASAKQPVSLKQLPSGNASAETAPQAKRQKKQKAKREPKMQVQAPQIASESDGNDSDVNGSGSVVKTVVSKRTKKSTKASAKTKLCIDFKRGNCTRGEACKYDHSGTTVSTDADGSSRRVGGSVGAKPAGRENKAPLNPKTVEVNNEIALCGQRKQLREAQKIFEIACRKDLANVYTYSIYLNVLVNGGDMSGAVDLFEEMRTEFPANGIGVVAFTSMVKGLCSQGELFKALVVYDTMKQPTRKGGPKKSAKRKQSGSDPNQQQIQRWVCVPNLRTINTLLRGCLISGDAKAAEEIFAEMQAIPRCAPDASTFDYYSGLLGQGLQYRKLTDVLPLSRQLSSAGTDGSVSTELPEVLIALARAGFLLGYDGSARKFLQQARRQLQKAIANDSYGGHGGHSVDYGESGDGYRKPLAIAEGGRRAGTQSRADDERRQESNRIFRRHRASEMLRAVHSLERFMTGDAKSHIVSGNTEEAGRSKAAEQEHKVVPSKELVQLSKTMSRLLASPSKKKEDSKSVHPDLLPFYLRLFSSTSPVVQHTTSASRRTLTDQIVSRERHRIGTLAAKKAGVEKLSGETSNTDDKKASKKTKQKKKKFGHITVPFHNIFERLDQQQAKAATDPDEYASHLAAAAVHRFGFAEYLHAWARRRPDLLLESNVPDSDSATTSQNSDTATSNPQKDIADGEDSASANKKTTPIATLRLQVKEHNDEWKVWLSKTEAGKAVKATSRKKRSVDPKNYAWTGLNQFLSTIGLGHDASENPHHQTNAAKPDSAAASSVAPPTKRAKTDSKGASQAAESRSSLKSWCTQGQVALLNFYRSVLVANTDTDAVEATKQKKSNTPRAFLDLNKVLDVTNALSGTTQKDGHAREWKLEIGSGSGEWAAKQALADPNGGWATLELRHDRAYRSWMHAVMQGIPNLCVLAGSVFDVVPNHLANASFDRVFVNHPEPPQQQGGGEGDSSDEDEDEEGGVGSVESDHMLKPQFFEEIQRVLKVGGTVTVLTDNEWYGNFLASTLDGFAESGKCLLESVDLECTSTDAASANTSSVDYIDSATSARSRQVADKVGSITLYEGEPGPDCGYEQSISGQSYFDRLWSRGVSRHADQSRRWFICLRRVTTVKQRPPASASGSTAASKATALAARDRSAEKSARRSRKANDRSDSDDATSSDSDSESFDGRHNFSSGATVNHDEEEAADFDVDSEEFEGLPKIDYEALERKIQELEAADAAEKAKTTQNVEAQLKAQRQSTKPVGSEAAAEPARPKKSSSNTQKLKQGGEGQV